MFLKASWIHDEIHVIEFSYKHLGKFTQWIFPFHNQSFDYINIDFSPL